MIQDLCIVLLGSIGDVARGLALVSPIKSRYPDARITWIVEPKSKDLLALNPKIDRVVVFNRATPWRSILELRKELGSTSFDITLDLQRHFKSGFFSRLTRAKRIIGFDRRSSKEFNWLFSTEHIPCNSASVPKIERYLSFLPMIDVEIPKTLDFGIRESSLQLDVPDSVPQSGAYLTFILGSSWRSKDWFLDGYLKLARKILDNSQYSIVIVGDNLQKENGDKLVAECGKRVVNLAGKTSLKSAIGVIARSKLLIGPDSGPGHIAAALEVPQVSMFGATDPRITAPWGSEDLIVKASLGCSPCYLRECPGLNRLCMRLISPDEVFKFVDPFLR